MAGGRYSVIALGSGADDYDTLQWRAIIFDAVAQRIFPMGGTHWVWSSETAIVRGSSLYDWPLYHMEQRSHFSVLGGYVDEETWEWVEEGEWIPVVIWEDSMALQDPSLGEGTLRVGATYEEESWD